MVRFKLGLVGIMGILLGDCSIAPTVHIEN